MESLNQKLQLLLTVIQFQMEPVTLIQFQTQYRKHLLMDLVILRVLVKVKPMVQMKVIVEAEV